jgi:hypothetical protein
LFASAALIGSLAFSAAAAKDFVRRGHIPIVPAKREMSIVLSDKYEKELAQRRAGYKSNSSPQTNSVSASGANLVSGSRVVTNTSSSATTFTNSIGRVASSTNSISRARVLTNSVGGAVSGRVAVSFQGKAYSFHDLSSLSANEVIPLIRATKPELRKAFLSSKTVHSVSESNRKIYLPMVDSVASGLGLSKEQANIFKKIVVGESSCNPFSVSATGGLGLSQLTSYVYNGVMYEPINPFNPRDNLHLGATFFKDLWKKYGGDKEKVLMAYNRGESEVDNALALVKKGKLKHWREAQYFAGNNYPQYILSRKV